MSKQKEDGKTSPVIGIRPDGTPILSPDDLPFLPVPKEIVIANGTMRIDQWGFSLRLLSRKSIYWMRERADMWLHLDPSEENRRWVQAVLQTWKDEIRKGIKS